MVEVIDCFHLDNLNTVFPLKLKPLMRDSTCSGVEARDPGLLPCIILDIYYLKWIVYYTHTHTRTHSFRNINSEKHVCHKLQYLVGLSELFNNTEKTIFLEYLNLATIPTKLMYSYSRFSMCRLIHNVVPVPNVLHNIQKNQNHIQGGPANVF